MIISEVMPILKAEFYLKRTPKGRSISEDGLSAVRATAEDSKNQDEEAIKCLNCGIILSSLVVPDGCPNCGSKDLDYDFVV